MILDSSNSLFTRERSIQNKKQREEKNTFAYYLKFKNNIVIKSPNPTVKTF